jgi:hypothetical protein
MVYKEALDNILLWRNNDVEFVWQATPNFFDSILFRAARWVILNVLNKINQADIFESPWGKNPQKAPCLTSKINLQS